MRVKRLEIQGFKSFKDKTVLHFDQGITGIVGPNGCGKSNIVDAFFWVMGEQSYKHMRGSGSDDLIFNGSSRYSPLGMAEATLVLEAPAGDEARNKEVSVTRKLYRGGDGEYFINGVPARLKDIQELFMDTGVGAKGYSVIEQGQIGKIVNSKPEERRVLIEEAAGIAKYKARKKESLRKMEATQANLARLTDVIQEIERSLGSLERQAQKARQYKKYREELLDKEMTWGRRKIQVLRQRLERLTGEKAALEAEILGLGTELQVGENALEADRVELLTDTKASEDQQEVIQRLSDDLTHEKSALELSRQRQGDLASQLGALEAEKQELGVSIASERAALEARQQEAGRSDDELTRASERAREMDGKARAAREGAERLREDLDQAKRALMDGIRGSSELASKAASLLGRMESAQAQLARLEQQASSHAARLESLREEDRQAEAQSLEARASVERLREERQTLSAAIREQEASLQSFETSRDESARGLTQLRSRLQSLEELSLAHEGFGDGPKAALDWAKREGRAERIVSLADALRLSPKHPEYATALEGWLESRLESLIASDGATALGALEHVSRDQQGRIAVELASLASVASKAVTSAQARSALESAGFEVLGELSQFIELDPGLAPRVRERAEQSIARVMVVRSFAPMPAFLAHGTDTLAGWSVASLDGSALGESGLLRGGPMKADGGASLLRRKSAMAELTAQLAAGEAAHQEREASLAALRQEAQGSRARLEALQAELQALEVRLAGLDRDVHQSKRSLEEGERQLQAFAQERQALESESAQALAERAKIETELAALDSAKSGLDARISGGEERVLAQAGALRSLEEELHLLRIEEARLRERASGVEREIGASRSLVTDRERRLGEIDRTLERALRERDEFSGGESGMHLRIEELARELASAKDALAQVKDRIERNNAKSDAALERIKQLRKACDQKTADSSQLALEVERVSSEISHLTLNLEEKYGPGCLELPVTSPIQEEMNEPVVTAEMSVEEEQALGEEVERLRERIRRLGEVNVMAIEEFEELNKRHEYLVSERSDLEQSVENLQEAIEHINKTSEERFKKAFEAISDRFERLFPIIFGGGQARLSLIYPEGSQDILEAGVDILAQPLGKTVVNIGLLSGGEKALTAISLIFAIFLVKPSPFCVLDEVDAPLDDGNIGKFNALLREMSARSQFILITHNKKTMELNDTLYGVTMEEPGVSKMVSIEMH